MNIYSFPLACVFTLLGITTLPGQNKPDLVRLGNLKFAHYGAVSYMPGPIRLARMSGFSTSPMPISIRRCNKNR